MRLLGLDYGAATIGVAVSDETGRIAARLETIRREREHQLRKSLARLEELVSQYHAEAFVLGFPLNMDDSEGARAKETLAFKERLERRTGLPVFLQDERLTSVEAESILRESGKKSREIKELVDMVAAELILQEFLDKKGTDGADYAGN